MYPFGTLITPTSTSGRRRPQEFRVSNAALKLRKHIVRSIVYLLSGLGVLHLLGLIACVFVDLFSLPDHGCERRKEGHDLLQNKVQNEISNRGPHPVTPAWRT